MLLFFTHEKIRLLNILSSDILLLILKPYSYYFINYFLSEIVTVDGSWLIFVSDGKTESCQRLIAHDPDLVSPNGFRASIFLFFDFGHA